MENIIILFKYIFLIILILIGMSDFRKQIIPNYLSISLIIISLIYRVSIGEWKSALLGIGGSFIIGSTFFLLNATGGGDVKFMMGLSAALGFRSYLEILFIASLIGSVWGIGKIIQEYKSTLSPNVKNVGHKLEFFKMYLIYRLKPKNKLEKIKVPVGACLSIATIFIVYC